MTRSGYSDDYADDDPLAGGRWRAQVASAMRGKRGQRFFLDLVAALDAMPKKELIAGDLEGTQGAVCALGAIGKHRGIALKGLDTDNYDGLGDAFDIAHQLAQEVMFQNDERGFGSDEARWQRMRAWAVESLTPETLLSEQSTMIDAHLHGQSSCRLVVSSVPGEVGASPGTVTVIHLVSETRPCE